MGCEHPLGRMKLVGDGECCEHLSCITWEDAFNRPGNDIGNDWTVTGTWQHRDSTFSYRVEGSTPGSNITHTVDFGTDDNSFSANTIAHAPGTGAECGIGVGGAMLSIKTVSRPTVAGQPYVCQMKLSYGGETKSWTVNRTNAEAIGNLTLCSDGENLYGTWISTTFLDPVAHTLVIAGSVPSNPGDVSLCAVTLVASGGLPVIFWGVYVGPYSIPGEECCDKAPNHCGCISGTDPVWGVTVEIPDSVMAGTYAISVGSSVATQCYANLCISGGECCRMIFVNLRYCYLQLVYPCVAEGDCTCGTPDTSQEGIQYPIAIYRPITWPIVPYEPTIFYYQSGCLSLNGACSVAAGCPAYVIVTPV